MGGGLGSWDLIVRDREHVFAAAAPMCGGGSPVFAPLLHPCTPLWFFHADSDSTIHVDESNALVLAAQQAGASVQFTRYTDEEMLDWELQHTRFTERAPCAAYFGWGHCTSSLC